MFFLARVLSVSSFLFGMFMIPLGMMNNTPQASFVGLLAALIGAFFMVRLLVIRVVEHEAIVVHNHTTGGFSRFLGTGLHLLNFYETPEFRLSTAPALIQKEMTGLRSKDGIAHRVTYDVLCEPNLSAIPFENQASQIHVIARQMRREAQSVIEKSLRHVMGKFCAEELSHGDVLQQLEQAFQTDVVTQLGEAGIDAKRVSIGEVCPPKLFKRSLIEAETRVMEAEYFSTALMKLKATLSELSDMDKQILINLEIHRMMSHSSNPMLYSMGSSQMNAPMNPDLVVKPQILAAKGRTTAVSQRRVH